MLVNSWSLDEMSHAAMGRGAQGLVKEVGHPLKFHVKLYQESPPVFLAANAVARISYKIALDQLIPVSYNEPEIYHLYIRKGR
jgi:hypothetical protein